MNGLGSFLRKTGLLLLALFCVSVLLPTGAGAAEDAFPSISVDVSGSPSSGVKPGDSITFTITVSNTGNVYVSSIIVGADSIYIDEVIPQIAPGSSRTLTSGYTVTDADVDAGKIDLNVTAVGRDPNSEAVSASDNCTVTTAEPRRELKIDRKHVSKPDSGNAYKVGDVITFEIIATNSGEATLTGVNIQDPDLGVTWYVETLFPGESVSKQFTHTVTEEDSANGSFCGVPVMPQVYIYTEDDLFAFAERVNKGTHEICAVLMEDITISEGTKWIPIDAFAGVFRGENHIIRGLNVVTSGNGGMFRKCNGTNISNLTVYGEVSGAGTYVGGIAGSFSGSMVNCFFFGDVSGISFTDCYVGGIVGGIFEGSIKNCGHAGFVRGYKGCSGGIAGLLLNEKTVIEHCYHYNTESPVISIDGSAGSIVGESDNPSGIKECYASSGSADALIGHLVNNATGSAQSCGLLDAEGFRNPASFSGWDVGYDAKHDWVMGWDYPLPVGMSDYITLDHNYTGSAARAVWMIRDDMVMGNAEPVREGYAFVGWNTRPNGGAAYYAGDNVSAHITLYAQWGKGVAYQDYIPFKPTDTTIIGVSGETYKMLLDGDISTKWCTDIPVNGNALVLELATKDYVRPNGYFLVTAHDSAKYPGRNPKGWKLEGLGHDGTWEVIDEVTNDRTLPDQNGAKGYKALNNSEEYCQFRITFTGVKGGTVFQLAEFFLTVEDPEKDVRKPRITLDPNTVSIDGNTVVKMGDNRSEITLGDDPYGLEAYTLLEWNTDPNGRGDRYEADNPFRITKDETVYAIYEAKCYELSVKLDETAGSPTFRRIVYTTDTEFKLTPPDRDKYVFEYWIVTVEDGSWKLGEKYGAGTNIYGTYGNVTLAGHWKQLQEYTVSWFNEGKLIDKETYYEGDIPEYKGEKPAFDGGKEYEYTFTGWDKEFKALTGDTSFNAVYEKNRKSYPVHFEMNGAGAIKDASVEYGSTVNKPDVPEYNGFVFDGWFADPECKTPYTFEEKIMDETTIYAKWTAIQSAPKLTDSEKPAAKTEITANGQPVALIDAPQNVPEGYTVQYSLDGKTWSTEIPTGTKSGVYTVHIFYKGDDYHEDFYGDDITVTLRGVYNCDATTSEWTKGSGKTVEFRFKKEFNDEDCFERFTGILVDGKAAERDKDYTAVKGSTIITFSAEFLETLELGDHSVKALFEDGEATVGIKVIEPAPATPAKDPSAATGDSSNLVLWIILALVSISAIVVLIVVKRKKE